MPTILVAVSMCDLMTSKYASLAKREHPAFLMAIISFVVMTSFMTNVWF